MGSVLTPLQWGLREAADLPNACTLNGRCAEVCPVRIPLSDLLRRLRERLHDDGLEDARSRWLMRIWGGLALRPRLYRLASRMTLAVLRAFFRSRGARTRLPGAGAWTDSRDLPAPEGRTFFQLYRRQSRSEASDELP
jgi:L-lactate dehydrogenase complex protein LldF